MMPETGRPLGVAIVMACASIASALFSFLSAERLFARFKKVNRKIVMSQVRILSDSYF